MVTNKRFIHRKFTPSNGHIPNTLMTIWYNPVYQTLVDSYDFQIYRVSLCAIENSMIFHIFDKKTFEDLDDETVEIAFSIMLNDGIVDELAGNHHRFHLSKYL